MRCKKGQEARDAPTLPSLTTTSSSRCMHTYIDMLVGAAGLSDLGSRMWVYTLVMMALTGLNDSGGRKILWVAAELHPVQ